MFPDRKIDLFKQEGCTVDGTDEKTRNGLSKKEWAADERRMGSSMIILDMRPSVYSGSTGSSPRWGGTD